MTAAKLLTVRDLTLDFPSPNGPVRVLHGVSLHVDAGEKVALVGESGSGKSVTARIVMGLLDRTGRPRIDGTVHFAGTDQAKLGRRAVRAQRGTAMSMIFQDPTSALNPVYPIAAQFREVIARARPRLKGRDADALAIEALRDVSIPDPQRALSSYPFQLSGGMNQRVMIAMALINNPKLLIADEPGTALDVTVQAQTLDLMRDRAAAHGAAVFLISHNLGVVREFADRIYVIYKGRIVEQGPTAALFANPSHPYTQLLLSATPHLTGRAIRLGEIGDLSAPRVVHPGAEEPEVAA